MFQVRKRSTASSEATSSARAEQEQRLGDAGGLAGEAGEAVQEPGAELQGRNPEGAPGVLVVGVGNGREDQLDVVVGDRLPVGEPVEVRAGDEPAGLDGDVGLGVGADQEDGVEEPGRLLDAVVGVGGARVDLALDRVRGRLDLDVGGAEAVAGVDREVAVVVVGDRAVALQAAGGRPDAVGGEQRLAEGAGLGVGGV
jgi:hypothetical protein